MIKKSAIFTTLAVSSSLLITSSALALGPGDLGQKIQAREEKFASTAARRIEDLDLKRLQIASIAAQRKTELEKKLAAFKDKKKAAAAQRVDQNLNKINQQRTTEMLSNLDKMDKLVTRGDSRILELQSSGKDTSMAASASATAKTKIQMARDAVKSQQVNDYTLSVTSETTVKVEAKALRDKLYKDLTAVHMDVLDARNSVVDLLKALAAISGEKNGQ